MNIWNKHCNLASDKGKRNNKYIQSWKCFIFASVYRSENLRKSCCKKIYFNWNMTKRRDQVVSTHASQSGGPGFKFQPGDRLSWQVFRSFPQSLQADVRIEL
jgi:hypothetical protein